MSDCLYEEYWKRVQKCARGRLQATQEDPDDISGREWVLERGLEDKEELRLLAREGHCKSGARNMRVISSVGGHICRHSNCHENSMRAALGKRNLRYCTGVALGTFDREDDDIWRPHSWVEDDAGNVIEATPIRRRMYYGVCYTKEQLREILQRREDEGF